jgi:ketopantoate reductase
MYHNGPAIAATRPLVGHGTIVLTLQNGIDNGEPRRLALSMS